MATVVLAPQSAPSIFDQLAVEDRLLTSTITVFRDACAELAAKNGQGDPIRQRIRQALFQTRSLTRGSSR